VPLSCLTHFTKEKLKCEFSISFIGVSMHVEELTVYDIDKIIGDISDWCDGDYECIIEHIMEEFEIPEEERDELEDLMEEYFDWWNRQVENEIFPGIKDEKYIPISEFLKKKK